MDDRVYTQKQPIKQMKHKKHMKHHQAYHSCQYDPTPVRQPQGQYGKNGHVQNPEISVAENQLIML